MKMIRRPGGSSHRRQRKRKGTKAMFANYLAVAPLLPGGAGMVDSTEDLDRWFREEQAFRWERWWRE